MAPKPNSKFAVGTRHSVNGRELEIIEYVNARNVTVRFTLTGNTKTVQASKITNKSIKDELNPTIHGVGYLGLGKHKATGNRIYKRWESMLARCYSPTRTSFNDYGAKGITVSIEWHNYQNFAEWFIHQCKLVGEDPYSTKWQVDKDESGTKEYSPTGCQLIPTQRNMEIGFAKHWTFKDPQGNKVHIYNINKFCKEHGYHQSNFTKLVKGSIKSYKGYTLA